MMARDRRKTETEREKRRVSYMKKTTGGDITAKRGSIPLKIKESR